MPLLTPLTTSRLTIRPFEPACDARPKRSKQPRKQTAPLSEDEQWLQWAVSYHQDIASLYQPPRGDNAIMLNSTGKLVGLCGIIGCLIPFELMPEPEEDEPFDPSSQVDGIFYDICPSCRGQGYATEASRALIEYAFHQMKVRRITATTEADNLASIAVIKKLGMRIKVNSHEDGFYPLYMEVVGVLRNPEFKPDLTGLGDL